MISGLVAGLAGAFNAIWNLGATPAMASALTTVNALIITILGGVSTLIGPILGAGIWQFISQFFFDWFDPRWPLVFGILFVLIVMFLPYGIVGTWRVRSLGWQQSWQLGWKRMAALFKGKSEK
jgi:branched-chain amino acid transport system permease protein